MTVAYRLGIKAGMLLCGAIFLSSCSTLPPLPDIAPDPCVETTPPVNENVKLTASDASAKDQFGVVSVSGNTAIVGSPYEGDSIKAISGSAYTFVRDGDGWIQQAKLVASNATAWGQFGTSVSMDGDTAIIGEEWSGGSLVDSGSAYVFVRCGRVWREEAKLNASDAVKGDYFGCAVSISGDTAVVGAYRGNEAGSAYVFTRRGRVWIQDAKLTAEEEAKRYDLFGQSVSVSGDTIIVGATGDDVGKERSGSAYIFTRSGGIWSRQQKLKASDATKYGYFGASVSIDGNTAIVGAYDEAFIRTGSAYVFTRNGTVWTEQSPKLTSCDSMGDDGFGGSVSVSGDTVIVGAVSYGDSRELPGSAYIFKYDGKVWTRQSKLSASVGVRMNKFGESVSVSGDTALVGAIYDSDGAKKNAGAAYVFDLAKPKP